MATCQKSQTSCACSSPCISLAATPLDIHYMSIVHSLSLHTLTLSEVPIACIFVCPATNEIISWGHNLVNATRDSSRHAEIVAIDRLLSGGCCSDKVALDTKYINPMKRTSEGDDDGVDGECPCVFYDII